MPSWGASPLTKVSLSRMVASGYRIGVGSNPAPSVFGVHLSIGHIPLGTYTIPSRTGDLTAAVANAGTIESNSGSAIAAPIPRRSVRRGIAFLKTTMPRYTSFHTLSRRTLLKRRALNNPETEHRTTIIARSRAPHARPDGRL